MTEEKKPRGRPTLFTERLADSALKLAEAGATDEQIAEALGVGLRTFLAWKGRHADFRHALKNTKDLADELVEASLYQRAIGYSHPATKFFLDKGAVIREDYIEHCPPDTTAGIFWLKNRQPDRWRDKQEIKHSVEKDFSEDLKKLDQEELTQWLRERKDE